MQATIGDKVVKGTPSIYLSIYIYLYLSIYLSIGPEDVEDPQGCGGGQGVVAGHHRRLADQVYNQSINQSITFDIIKTKLMVNIYIAYYICHLIKILERFKWHFKNYY